eukprot:605871-Pleurochrysis_carterae.AAC.1
MRATLVDNIYVDARVVASPSSVEPCSLRASRFARFRKEYLGGGRNSHLWIQCSCKATSERINVYVWELSGLVELTATMKYASINRARCYPYTVNQEYDSRSK